MRSEFPEFRPGSVLATSFTATLTERCGDGVERIPTPQRLADWLAENGLAVESCTMAQLELARELRESIHAVVTAAAIEDALPALALQVIDDGSVHGRAAAILTAEKNRQWRLSSASRVEGALGVIAADATSIVAGERDVFLALCASPTCRAAFSDASQSRSRKWCDMNTCGNLQKKARFKAQLRKFENHCGAIGYDDRMNLCQVNMTSASQPLAYVWLPYVAVGGYARRYAWIAPSGGRRVGLEPRGPYCCGVEVHV